MNIQLAGTQSKGHNCEGKQNIYSSFRLAEEGRRGRTSAPSSSLVCVCVFFFADHFRLIVSTFRFRLFRPINSAAVFYSSPSFSSRNRKMDVVEQCVVISCCVCPAETRSISSAELWMLLSNGWPDATQLRLILQRNFCKLGGIEWWTILWTESVMAIPETRSVNFFTTWLAFSIEKINRKDFILFLVLIFISSESLGLGLLPVLVCKRLRNCEQR